MVITQNHVVTVPSNEGTIAKLIGVFTLPQVMYFTNLDDTVSMDITVETAPTDDDGSYVAISGTGSYENGSLTIPALGTGFLVVDTVNPYVRVKGVGPGDLDISLTRNIVDPGQTWPILNI